MKDAEACRQREKKADQQADGDDSEDDVWFKIGAKRQVLKKKVLSVGKKPNAKVKKGTRKKKIGCCS